MSTLNWALWIIGLIGVICGWVGAKSATGKSAGLAGVFIVLMILGCVVLFLTSWQMLVSQ